MAASLDAVQFIFKEHHREHSEAESIDKCSHRRIDAYVRATLTLRFVSLLITPAAILIFIEARASLKVILIAIITCAFAAVCNLVPESRPNSTQYISGYCYGTMSMAGTRYGG